MSTLTRRQVRRDGPTEVYARRPVARGLSLVTIPPRNLGLRFVTKEELLQRISAREDNFVERKLEGVKDRELRQKLGSFANSVPEGRTAVLFVGVQDTGEVVGVENPEALLKRVRDVCLNDCYPQIDHTVEILEVQGAKVVVAVVVPFSTRRPHFTGPAFVRVGAESRRASEQQYDELLLSRTDKAREILKHKDQIATVRGIGYKLGSQKALQGGHGYTESAECRVLSCNAHYVRLERLANNSHFNEALSRVEIGYDEEKWRLMLMVSGPRS